MKCQKIYIINYSMLSGAIMTNEHVLLLLLLLLYIYVADCVRERKSMGKSVCYCLFKRVGKRIQKFLQKQ